MTNGKQNVREIESWLHILEALKQKLFVQLVSSSNSTVQWLVTLELGETGTKPIDNGGWDSLTEDGNPYEPQPKVDKEAKKE
jgi:hypothetical protein